MQFQEKFLALKRTRLIHLTVFIVAITDFQLLFWFFNHVKQRWLCYRRMSDYNRGLFLGENEF